MVVRQHRVPLEAKGERLDAHLAKAFPDLSRARLRQLLEQGRVTLSSRAASKPALRLKGGEEVALEIPPPAPAEPQAQDLPLRVLHEDADLLVLDKAAGMVVHPAAGHADGTLVNALLHRVKDLRGVGGQLRPGIVHRLDRDTSGCLVVAKHEQALRALQQAFAGRDVHKRYLAIVHGVPRAAQATLDTPYGRHPSQRKKFTGKLKSGKRAVTSYRVRERFASAALLEVELHTGRTHQIRVHLAEAGHPLLGDQLYGRRRAKVIGRQALHAWTLDFPHPRTGERMAFEAPPPPDFTAALEALRAGAGG
ncbi:MAG TPA: RluA family pseudouridine synthase [Myxococcaceae bacterium]